MSSFGNRLSRTFAEFGQLCVGLDPSASQLTSWGLPDSAEGAKNFSLEVIAACSGEVGIVKAQVAFFEQYGPVGLAALSEVLLAASSAGLLVIADAKRGDIGSTMAGYSRAWLSKEASFFADALTLSPFLGAESLRATIEVALESEKGVFVLAATSNPEAAAVQGAKNGTVSVASEVVRFASSFAKSGLGSVGVVIGATVDLERVGISKDSLIDTPILTPGFGAQGIELSTASDLFGPLTPALICNVSRSIAGSSRNGLRERIAAAGKQLALGVHL